MTKPNKPSTKNKPKRGPAKGHGGRPRGSGKPAEALRVPLSCRVARDTLAALKASAAASRLGLGAYLDTLAADHPQPSAPENQLGSPSSPHAT